MIDHERLKQQLTKDDIISILSSLGADAPTEDIKGNLVFPTLCHNAYNGSYKLYYYNNTKLFKCYTECNEAFDIFELIERHKKLLDEPWKFENSLFYVMDITGYASYFNDDNDSVINLHEHRINDWEFLNRYKKVKKKTIKLPQYDETILNSYKKYYHQEWIDEEISIPAMKKFNIRYDVFNNKIIIPHYDIHNQLIGIRGRSLNVEEIEMGYKYMPVKVENFIYSHPVSCNLYGLNFNIETIKKLKKVFIVEGEKSVLKIESYYPNHNFSVAVCGDKISDFQKELILKHVDEVIIGFDKESIYAPRKVNPDLVKIRKIAQKFSPYVQTFIVADKKNLLSIKDSPVDKGQDVLEELMKTKVEVKTIGW